MRILQDKLADLPTMMESLTLRSKLPSSAKSTPTPHVVHVHVIPKKAPIRMPVTLNKLKVIHTFLVSSSWVQANKCMLWAAVTTAFFGFLRSEYCSTQTKKYDPEKTLCFEDVTYKHSNIYIQVNKHYFLQVFQGSGIG